MQSILHILVSPPIVASPLVSGQAQRQGCILEKNSLANLCHPSHFHEKEEIVYNGVVTAEGGFHVEINYLMSQQELGSFH